MTGSKLGDIATFVRGITFKPTDVVEPGTPGAVQCMRTKNVQAELDLSDVWAVDSVHVKRDNQFLRGGDILVSSANSWNLVGKCCWVPELTDRTTFGGFISTLRADASKVHPRYLYHWFGSSDIQATVRSFGRQTTNISNLDVQRCLDLVLPLPPLDEQARIADLLDKVNALWTRRREAIGRLDELSQSIFIDMFGDVVVNDRGWSNAEVSDVVKRFEGGKSFVADDAADPDAEFRVLKISAVTSGLFNPDENKAAPPGYVPPRHHFVRTGDLLFSRANTAELVGATALVEGDVPDNLLLPDKLWRFVWRSPRAANPAFVHQMFRQPRFRFEIGSRATGTSASMKNISQPKVLSIGFGLPPLELQDEFAQRVAAVQDIRRSNQSSLASLEALFTSLQYRAFRGEL
ncbi:restriction endonuclease subunit S [Pseudofrankia sp. DC12]|uniref:restriction endonuclease subunit S n=1 Tax=Pseudofrankia sp. DC12 TaxID=683315 RepID=UPI0005F7CB8D|nr:restriction endonuclease subunit S [Pseudofrankia sp. DC12]